MTLQFQYLIKMPWPRAPTFKNADPNDVLRPWLEERVGIQGIDWDWDGIYHTNELLISIKDINAAIEFKLTFTTNSL